MKNQNTQKLKLASLFAAVLMMGSLAQAGDINLINSALNSSLDERAQARNQWQGNESAERPENHFNERVHNDRIELTINGELNGAASDRLKDFDSPNRVYREGHLEAKLDKEARQVDKAFEKDLKKTAKAETDKPVGFEYSEAKLPK